MFDLITGTATHIPRRASVPILVSTGAQAVVLGLVVLLPVLFATRSLPQPPTMLAFVAAPPAPPPPPPPPAPARAARQPKPAAATPTSSQFVAPVEAPAAVLPEPAGEEAVGVEGGVEGGVPGGVMGGVVGGTGAGGGEEPLRVGGDVKAPVLSSRTEPQYPEAARKARMEGVVILEAIITADGNVEDVRVLKSVNPLLDASAVRAVQMWKYKPATLNGRAVRVYLTVTVTFRLN